LLHFSIVVQLIGMPIFDQMLALLDVSSDVVEFSAVLWVRKDVVPWGSNARLLWVQNFFQLFDSVWVRQQKSEVVLHVFFFSDNFVSL
jgi:hypothetical protein